MSQWNSCSFLPSGPLSITLFLILTILYCCEIFLGFSSHLSSPSLLAFVLCLEQWVFHLPLSFAIMPLCLLSSCSLCPFIPFTVCMHLTLLRHCLHRLTPCFLSVCPSPFLSCCLLCTHSPAIFLLLQDEPSSGMDPRTKRHLWKIISEEVKGKCAVILTSHR